MKIDEKNSQQRRVKMTPAQLPSDRESLFYLNLPDMPPLPEVRFLTVSLGKKYVY